MDRDIEPRPSEDVDHPMVLGEHLGEEEADPRLVGGLREVGDQQRSEPLALQFVGDTHADLGTVAALPDVLRACHDAPV